MIVIIFLFRDSFHPLYAKKFFSAIRKVVWMSTWMGNFLKYNRWKRIQEGLKRQSSPSEGTCEHICLYLESTFLLNTAQPPVLIIWWLFNYMLCVRSIFNATFITHRLYYLAHPKFFSGLEPREIFAYFVFIHWMNGFAIKIAMIRSLHSWICLGYILALSILSPSPPPPLPPLFRCSCPL